MVGGGSTSNVAEKITSVLSAATGSRFTAFVRHLKRALLNVLIGYVGESMHTCSCMDQQNIGNM